MEQGPGPSTLSTYPPPYLPGLWGLSLPAAFNKGGPGQWSGTLASSPTQNLWLRKMYVLYCSLFLSGLALKNPPKKTHPKKPQKTRLKKPQKTHPQVGFFGFF
jgi:hypothetical protein